MRIRDGGGDGGREHPRHDAGGTVCALEAFGANIRYLNGIPRMPPENPRILIIRLSAIGDVVRALPVLHILRDAYLHAQIDWAVERKSAQILEDHPCLDNVLVFERPEKTWDAVRAFRAFCREIRGRRYDIVLDMHGILKSGLIAGLSGAPQRYGFARPRAQELSWLFTNRRVRLGKRTMNRIEENLALCELVTQRVSWPNITMHVPEEIQEEVDAFIEDKFHGGKLLVAMHVPVDRPEKQWPIEHFARLSDLLLADGRFEVLLTWGPGQFAAVDKVMRLSRRRPVAAPDFPTLKHYAWAAHQAALYVGGDTGPMHIAWAMGTPVVAIFGGTDPAKHAPYCPPFETLHATDDWFDEGVRPTVEDRLARITPEIAYDACIRLLARTRALRPVAPTDPTPLPPDAIIEGDDEDDVTA